MPYTYFLEWYYLAHVLFIMNQIAEDNILNFHFNSS